MKMPLTDRILLVGMISRKGAKEQRGKGFSFAPLLLCELCEKRSSKHPTLNVKCLGLARFYTGWNDFSQRAPRNKEERVLLCAFASLRALRETLFKAPL